MSSTTTAHGLKRVLGRAETLALGFGAITGWSWIVLIADVMLRAGSFGAIAATLLGGAVIIVIGLLYGELASAMPEVGGEHAYSLRALGPLGSFFCTWAIVFTYVAVCGFEAVALPAVMTNLFPALGQGEALWTIAGSSVVPDKLLIGAGAAVLIGFLNERGVRLAAFVQIMIVCVILGSGLVLFTGMGVHGDIGLADPIFLGGAGLLSAMALVPFMMSGFDVIPQTAEEIDLPPRQIGKMIVWSLSAAVLWLVLVELSVAVLVPVESRPSGSLVTVLATEAAWGRPGAVILLIGGFAGILTSWNAFLIGGSRAMLAMANHNMLPAWFGRIHPKYGTPVNAIRFISLICFLAPFLGQQSFLWFVNAGSCSLMIGYCLVTWSFLKLRRREPEMERPFRVPAGWVLGCVGLIASFGMALLYLPDMPAALVWPQEWLMLGLWFVCGFTAYVGSRRSAGRPVR